MSLNLLRDIPTKILLTFHYHSHHLIPIVKWVVRMLDLSVLQLSLLNTVVMIRSCIIGLKSRIRLQILSKKMSFSCITFFSMP